MHRHTLQNRAISLTNDHIYILLNGNLFAKKDFRQTDPYEIK